MISAILFIFILKAISAPTWCFVLAWVIFAIDVLGALCKLWKAGKEYGQTHKKEEKK